MQDGTLETPPTRTFEEVIAPYHEFRQRFHEAFDELHGVLVQRIAQAGGYLPVNSKYPSMSTMPSGFPSFSDVGFYQENAPRHYM